MTENGTGLYQEIAARTGGDIYIGVVGPVRTGKSTFIKRFMETLVIPKIDNVYQRERARDELPQSGSGRIIMTAEPKFVPEEAAVIQLDGGGRAAVRLIDSVGYLVPGAQGHLDGDSPRMVTTPWFDHEIPMTQAAELGTRKVISEHSTIGIVMTTDGTITDIPREDYEEAEARVIGELKSLGKPFLVLLNSAQPDSPQTQALRAQLAERYDVTCLAVDCLSLGEEDISNLLRSVLYEFPLGELDVFLPDWVEALSGNHPLKSELFSAIRGAAASLSHIRQVEGCVTQLLESPSVSGAQVSRLDLGTGVATLNLEVPRSLFYEALEAQSGFRVENDGALFSLLEELGKMKAEYDKVAPALAQVWQEGYGIVVPQVEELTVEEPEVTRQGGRYGVRLKASAPSIHLVRSVPKPRRRKNKNLLLTIVRGTPII
jgi:stage IV sporulation protein A